MYTACITGCCSSLPTSIPLPVPFTHSLTSRRTNPSSAASSNTSRTAHTLASTAFGLNLLVAPSESSPSQPPPALSHLPPDRSQILASQRVVVVIVNRRQCLSPLAEEVATPERVLFSLAAPLRYAVSAPLHANATPWRNPAICRAPRSPATSRSAECLWRTMPPTRCIPTRAVGTLGETVRRRCCKRAPPQIPVRSTLGNCVKRTRGRFPLPLDVHNRFTLVQSIGSFMTRATANSVNF